MIMNRSIKARLILYISAFLIIIFAIGSLATTSLRSVDAQVDATTRKWLSGAALLGRLSSHISEYRAAESRYLLAPDADKARKVEASAAEHRAAITGVLGQYHDLIGPMADVNVKAFQRTWRNYLLEHDAWLASHNPQDAALLWNGALEYSRQATDNAVGWLVDNNQRQANREAEIARQRVGAATTSLRISTGAAVVLAGFILFMAWREICHPLAAITFALSRLAGGDRTIEVPETNRVDEIGELAKAFELFHGTMLALEKAHGETRAAQQQAQALARHDALTGLPNRRVFATELEAAVGKALQGAASHAVLLIDLDRFKPVNDIHGHAIGDLVLCEVARRIDVVAEAPNLAARLGGDEFAVIAEIRPGEKRPGDALAALATALLAAVRAPITIGDIRVEIGSSIGISICPNDGASAEVLLRTADIAMYRAKADGRDRFRFFEASMDEQLRDRASLEEDLRRAVAEQEIRPYYQPLMNLEDQRVYAFEVLSRWNHSSRGFVPPDVFIPLAEQLGLIPQLTFSILRQACRDLKALAPEIRLSLNVSPLHLRDPLLPTQILAILSEENFDPKRLEIEITESALVADMSTAKTILSTLQRLGITIALDDFGTGYSSLYHLREMKFDKIKIDRSFVQAMQVDTESEKIVDAVLGLAKNLGLRTVAEGIENRDTMARLSERGCQYGQGYYLGRPLAAESLAAVLDAEAAEGRKSAA
jgi:diguanylate cyclase (GGDEF)-like protein